MAGDYTRFTFDPAKGFSGVHKQQGRVSLDADFNEFEEILDRRRRAHTYDTFNSRAIVPRTTQNGFKIYLTGPQLTIGPGRAYVDGILAECFGNMSLKLSHDNVLGGVSGGQLAYDKQPFYYTPGYPDLKAGSINTVYLDVWQREVTVFEDDSLREPALNGPDTATRVQTAWQVKVLDEPAKSTNCADTPPGWKELTAPSTVRLTARADEVLAPPPGPCEINPASGYSGLENRLYRVEIHRGGTLGGATKPQFKWSRDNASLAARVVKVDKAAQSTLTVSSTGRDKVTRFAVNDHIELIDDDVEFAMRETGKGGDMLRVMAVDHGKQTITVNSNLALFTLQPSRHPRIRRWDYRTLAEPILRDVAAGAPNILENGISVTFAGTATDTLHAGDYWVFEARTVDGSIGRLVDAPPRGILHHFAKLAYVTVGNMPTDCRTFWPPTFTGGGTGEGCCTVVVKPGDDIQSAIDSLGGKGGCVCLKMGVHVIPSALRIDQDNVTMHAEAPWVTVRLADGGPLMLRILAASNVSVLGIKFEAQNGGAGTAMIELRSVHGGHLADCALGFIEKVDLKWTAAGISMQGCTDYVIEDNSLVGFSIGIIGQESTSRRLRIIGNMLTGPFWQVTDNLKLAVGTMGIAFKDVEGIDVERNVVSHYRRGIEIGNLSAAPARPKLDLGLLSKGCRIVENVVERLGDPAASRPWELFDAGGSPTVVAFGIAVRMPRCEILENAVRIGGLGDSGILADCGNVLVARNLVQSAVRFDPAITIQLAPPSGVVATVRDADGLSCVVRDNLFLGMQQAIRVSGTLNGGDVRQVEVISNRIVGSADLFLSYLASIGTGASAATAAVLLVERFASIAVVKATLGRVANNDIHLAICGILCAAATRVAIQGNSIAESALGVTLGLAADCEANDNLIDQAIVGVLLAGTQRLAVESNVVSRSPAGIVELLGKATRIDSNYVSGGLAGIDVLAVEAGELRGNTVEDATFAGIVVAAVSHDVTLSHNKAIRCGYREKAANTTLALGILVAATDASVLLESCQAIDTGESVDRSAFAGARLGIAVAGEQLRVRVHGCTITSPPMVTVDDAGGRVVPHTASRALVISGIASKQTMTGGMTGAAAGGNTMGEALTYNVAAFLPTTEETSLDCADAADNLAEQEAPIVVEIVTPGEVIFASNRCTRLGTEQPNEPVVTLTGSGLAVTGNRVRATSKTPSLELRAVRVLTAVANISTAGASIAGVPEIPAGYNNFNATT
jgi:nitrous oxidase accessory protein NosD